MQHPDDMDYYALLGVDRASPPSEITRAFHRLARQYHPDLHPQDPEADSRFKSINEAYQVLSDPEKRAEYDQQFVSSQPSSAPDERAESPQQADFVRQEEIDSAVADVAAEFEEIARQAAEELRSALRGFGAELDSLVQTYHAQPDNRATRRGHGTPPRNGRPPWNGRPPRDGRPPYDGKAPKP